MHIASVLSRSAAEAKGFQLNTDRTTKQQKKLVQWESMMYIVISVNELPDGTAVSAIEDVSKELEKLVKLLMLFIYLMQTKSIGV